MEQKNRGIRSFDLEIVMTNMRRLLLVSVLMGFFLTPLRITADIGPIDQLKTGGVASPESPHKTIRLDSQEVIIRLKKKYYTVDAVFHFFNTGQTSTEWVGFPKWITYRTVPYPTATFTRFGSWINDRPVTFSEEIDLRIDARHFFSRLYYNLSEWFTTPPKDAMEASVRFGSSVKHERRWMVHRATFPGQAGTRIRVLYQAPYVPGYKLEECETASYLYGTGAGWMGRIGKAVFIIDVGEVGGTKNVFIQTKPRLWPQPISDSVVRYEIKNFEPEPEESLHVEPCPEAKIGPRSHYR